MGMASIARVVTLATTASGRLSRSRILPGTTYGTGFYSSHRLDTVRQFNIRAAAIPKDSFKTTPSFQTLLKDAWSEEQATVPAGDLSQFKPEQGASINSVKVVEEWRSSLVLPSDEFLNKWAALLQDYDTGGLLTAQKFVERWCDCQPETTFHVREETKGDIKISQCTFEVPVPMLGLRKVISYGCSRADAISNSNIALVSQLYQDGGLDSIYKGTIASRRLMAIYEEAAHYGLYPKFRLSMSPDHRFQLTLNVPEWNLFASVSDPKYIVALTGVVDSYESKAKRDGVKTPLSPQVSRTMDILDYRTASRALRFLVQKLQLDQGHEVRRLDDLQGPQWTYRIFIKGVRTLEFPTIRQGDSRYIATTTMVVRLLQRFGFDNMRGFKEYLKVGEQPKTEQAYWARRARNSRKTIRSRKGPPESERLDQVEQAVTATSEETLGQLKASSRYSRR